MSKKRKKGAKPPRPGRSGPGVERQAGEREFNEEVKVKLRFLQGKMEEWVVRQAADSDFAGVIAASSVVFAIRHMLERESVLTGWHPGIVEDLQALTDQFAAAGEG